MENAAFVKLSAEMRNRIYQEVLLEADGIQVYFFPSGARPLVEPQRKGRLAITAVCHQIREESLPMFYGANRFTLRTSRLAFRHCPMDREIECFLPMIGTRAAMLLRDIHVVARWKLLEFSSDQPTIFVRCMRKLYTDTKANLSLKMEVSNARGTLSLHPSMATMLGVPGLQEFKNWTTKFMAATIAERAARLPMARQPREWLNERVNLARMLEGWLAFLIEYLAIADPALATMPPGLRNDQDDSSTAETGPAA